MLRITNAQFEALREEALSTFEASMIKRFSELSPLHAGVLGERGLFEFVRAARAGAQGHGFTRTGPVRLYIELAFFYGIGFGADAQYPWAKEALGDGDPESQIGRSMTLFEGAKKAGPAIDGPDKEFKLEALRALFALLSAPLEPSGGDLCASALAAMAKVHPQKHAFVGEPALRALFGAASSEASARGLSDPPSVLLIALLMFAFGQGCLSDPLYPWMERALKDKNLSSPILRAEKLKDKALVWVRALHASEAVRS